jgi:hypothetical protein
MQLKATYADKKKTMKTYLIIIYKKSSNKMYCSQLINVMNR